MSTPSSSTPSTTRFALVMLLLWAVGMALLVLGSIGMADGKLIYTLDDPYIHLAVTENILRGGYGVNFPEYSTPSSSILYPFLLVPGVAMGMGDIWPLLINLAAMGAVVWLLAGFCSRHLPLLRGLDRGVLVLVLVLALNGFGLPMTGMEHSLHLLCVVVAIDGLSRTEAGEPPRWPLILALGIMPLVRFEGLALGLAGIGLLAWRGHRRAAGLALALISAGFLGWFALTRSMEMPFFPSSVLVKSESTASLGTDASTFDALWFRFTYALLNNREAQIFWVYLVGLWLMGARLGRYRWLALAVGVAVAGHLLMGRYGWFHRYEIYANAMVLMTLVVLLSAWLQRLYAGGGQPLALIMALLLAFYQNIHDLPLIPAASRNIHDQQYQMHRFATDYWRAPVAVNDLGWVSYRNDAYVLDLYGLGSEEARKLRANGAMNGAMMDQLTRKAGVDLVMIYTGWYDGKVVDSWCLLGVLTTPQVTAAETDVYFYATTPQAAARARTALAKFVSSLPKRVTWTAAMTDPACTP